ncbi:MAG TPA: hypothetical protein VG733_08775 [Chthoniobacteraceae bacterium]|nr:hypothetical protein [Chthoniobacteraceae bacterium]
MRNFLFAAGFAIFGSVAAGQGMNYPEPTPIRNADPSVTTPVAIKVATRLKVTGKGKSLVVEADTHDALETIKIAVGRNMVTGLDTEYFVYPEGQARPRQSAGSTLEGVTDFDKLGNELGVSLAQTADGKPTVKGTKYVVEIVMTIFQTDEPPQHMWGPEGGKLYKVLWTRTLKQVVTR